MINVITNEETTLSKISTKPTKPFDYILELEKGFYLDAHPLRYPYDVPKFAWIGSYVNEPSEDESPNAILNQS